MIFQLTPLKQKRMAGIPSKPCKGTEKNLAKSGWDSVGWVFQLGFACCLGEAKRTWTAHRTELFGDRIFCFRKLSGVFRPSNSNSIESEQPPGNDHISPLSRWFSGGLPVLVGYVFSFPWKVFCLGKGLPFLDMSLATIHGESKGKKALPMPCSEWQPAGHFLGGGFVVEGDSEVVPLILPRWDVDLFEVGGLVVVKSCVQDCPPLECRHGFWS